MRGKGSTDEQDALQLRITPAHAGKRHPAPAERGQQRDHPRACGEKNYNLNFPSKPMGSPPRMRGKGVAGQVDEHLGGITPAHAGKSDISKKLHHSGKDHPRACGEKSSMRNTTPP